MRRMGWLLALAAMAAVSACVTINVYFPEAAAEKAAERFVDEVLGPQGGARDDDAARAPRGASLWQRLSPLGVAYAQADISIDTPAIQAIQARMAERFRGTLEPHFDSGALGFTRDGKVAVREAGKVPLAQRSAVQQAVADENRDRDAVYREIAVANGHPEWEGDIRATFARQWIDRAKSGWWYQDPAGTWMQK